MMTKTTPADMARSGVLQDDRLHDVGDVLDGVQGRLHGLDDVLPLQDLERLVLTAEEPSQAAVVDGVAFSLQLVDGLEKRTRTSHALQPSHETDGLIAHLYEQIGLLLELGQDGLDGEESEEVGDRQHVIDHVVELFSERVDVLAVEGGDEGLVETLEDLGGQLIAATFAVDHEVVFG